MNRTMGSWLFLVLFIGGCSTAAPEPIWIGHLAPLSGAQRWQGETAVAAMQLSLEKIREEDGKVAGRAVGVRHADSVSLARAEAVRLLAVNHVVGLILGPGLADPEEVAASARTHGAAVVILDETPVVPTLPAVKLLGPDPARRGRALAHFARTKLKKKRFALLVDRRNAVCAALASAFAAVWREKGDLREWRIAEASGLPALRPDLEKYAPDGFLAAVPADRLMDLEPILPSTPILYGGPDVDEAVLSRFLASGKARGEWYTAAVYTGSTKLSESSAAWRQQYEKRMHEPPGRSAILARDGLLLMMAGLEKARSGLRERLRQELPQIEEFESFTGKLTWKDGMAVRPLFLVRLGAGQTNLVETLTGDEP